MTGNTASFTSASGLTNNMTQTSPDVYTLDDDTFGSVTFRPAVRGEFTEVAHCHRGEALLGELSLECCSLISHERDKTNFKLSQAG